MGFYNLGGHLEQHLMQDFFQALDYFSKAWQMLMQAQLLPYVTAIAGAATSWILLRWKYRAAFSRLQVRLGDQQREIARLRASGVAAADQPARDKHGLYLNGRQIGQVSTRPKVDHSGQIIIFAAATSSIDLKSGDHIEFRDLQLRVESFANRRSVSLIGHEPRIGYENLRCRIMGSL